MSLPRKRWSTGSTLSIAMLSAALGTASAAQTLDLSGPAAPAAGRGDAALEIADRLEREAQQLLRSGVDETDSGTAAAAVAARSAVRLAGAALARHGEARGGDGSAAVLWAMTLHARMDEIDSLIAGLDDPILLAAMAADLEALALAWSRGAPARADAFDAQIGSALAPLARGLEIRAGAGWFGGPAPDPAQLAEEIDVRLGALEDAGWDGARLADLRSVADGLRRSAPWPAYIRAAAEEGTRVVAAIDGVLGLPASVPEPARARLLDDLHASVRDGSAEGLALIAAQARVFGAIDRMEPGREADRLAARAAEAVAARQPAASGPMVAAAELAARTLELSVSRADFRRDDHLVRSLRPAWRALVPRVRGVTVNARDEAVTLLIDPDRMTQPGVLSTIASQRELMADFAMLERSSGALERGLTGGAGPDGSGPGGAGSIERSVRDRLLAAGQQMRSAEGFEEALGLLRRFDAQRRTLARIDRDRESAVLVAGERGAELEARIDGLREAWLRGWAIAGGNGPDESVRGDLELIDRLIGLLADAAGFTRLDTLDAWPGVELTGRSIRVLSAGLTERIDELLPDALRAGNAVARDRSLARIVSLRGDAAGALVIGRLARTGERAGMVRAAAIEEIGLGPPSASSWMAEHRAVLADISRYSEELALAIGERQDEAAVIAPLRSVVAWRALRLLERLEAAEADSV
ncbi:MAG: hypothetical protein AAGF47_00740 [Planctomycetota bacterium]